MRWPWQKRRLEKVDRVELAAAHLESVARRSYLALGRPLPPPSRKRQMQKRG